MGMDPDKRSATIEVMAADETVLGGGRFDTDRAGLCGDGRLREAVAAPGVGDRGLSGYRRAPRHPPVMVTVVRDERDRALLVLKLANVPSSTLDLSPPDLTSADLVAKLENRLRGLESVRDRSLADISRYTNELAQAEQQLGEPFHTDALAAARQELENITTRIEGETSPPITPGHGIRAVPRTVAARISARQRRHSWIAVGYPQPSSCPQDKPVLVAPWFSATAGYRHGLPRSPHRGDRPRPGGDRPSRPSDRTCRRSGHPRMADPDQPIPLASPDISAPTADTPQIRAGVDALLTAVSAVFAAAAQDQARPEAQRGAYAVAATTIGQATGRLR